MGCDICVASTCADARHTNDTHAFPQTTLFVVSKSRLIASSARHLLVTEKKLTPHLGPPIEKCLSKNYAYTHEVFEIDDFGITHALTLFRFLSQECNKAALRVALRDFWDLDLSPTIAPLPLKKNVVCSGVWMSPRNSTLFLKALCTSPLRNRNNDSM